MNYRMLVAISLAVLLASPVLAQPPLLPVTNVAFRTLEQSTQSAHGQAGQWILKNQGEWNRFWLQNHFGLNIVTPPPGVASDTAPEVDFSKEMVLAVAQGSRMTGGYAVTVARILEDADHLSVLIVRKSPTATASVIQILTSPCHYVALPKTAKKLVYRFVDYEGRLAVLDAHEDGMSTWVLFRHEETGKMEIRRDFRAHGGGGQLFRHEETGKMEIRVSSPVARPPASRYVEATYFTVASSGPVANYWTKGIRTFAPVTPAIEIVGVFVPSIFFIEESQSGFAGVDTNLYKAHPQTLVENRSLGAIRYTFETPYPAIPWFSFHKLFATTEPLEDY